MRSCMMIRVLNALFFFAGTQAFPVITNPIADQLSFNSHSPASISSATIIPSGAVGVIVPPKWSFSLGFQFDTCSSGDEEITYSIQDIPAWLAFDEGTLTLYGVSPSKAINVSMALVCSHEGQQVLQSFQVCVGLQLELATPLPAIVTSTRNHVSYVMPKSLIAGQKALASFQARSLHLAVDDEAFSWLRWDLASQHLQGTVPDSYLSLNDSLTTNLPVIITSADSFPLPASLTIAIIPYIFTSFDLPDVTVTADFSLSLQNFIRDPSAIITADLYPPSDPAWLFFNPELLTLAGTPSRSVSTNEVINITLNAQDLSKNLTASTSFRVHFQGKHSERPATNQSKPMAGILSRRTIIIIIVSTVAGVLLLFAFVYFGPWICASRKASENRLTEEKPVRDPHGHAGSQISPSISNAQSLGEKIDEVGQSDDAVLEHDNTSGWLAQERSLSHPSNCSIRGINTSRRRSRSSSRSRSASNDARSPISSPTSSSFPNHTHSPAPQLARTGTISNQRSRTPSESSVIPQVLSTSARPPLDAAEHRLHFPPAAPKPPSNLTPEERKQWVDHYVCQWSEGYVSETSRRSSRRRRSGPDSQLGELVGSSSGWDGMPSGPGPGSSNFDRSFFSSPSDGPLQAPITHSASHLTCNSEAHLPSEISSVASWDSLDSWEMERRAYYEEPIRRSDFQPPSTTPITQVVKNAVCSNPRRDTVGDEGVPSIIITGDHGPKPITVPEPVHVVGSPLMGETQILPSSDTPGASGHTPSFFGEEEEIVFFPRPVGCEPGHGMARSPNLEGLSRFGGRM